MPDTHTFVVPTFGRPAWLAECLESLRAQTVRSRILVTTSTPNEEVQTIAAAQDVPVVVNPECGGIGADWNFALAQAPAGWVTIAHQDDWYAPAYAERCLEGGATTPRPLLVFSSCTEVFEETGREVGNVAIKRAICEAVFAGGSAITARWRKRLLLSFADPIPCPAVMLYRDAAPRFAFERGWKCGLDWAAWLELARHEGAFVYVREALVRRRVHPGCTTQVNLDARAEEDSRILRQLWPAPVAGIIAAMYARSHRQYR
jgi:glycosyltransferase involved in cell wall biosynthesis